MPSFSDSLGVIARTLGPEHFAPLAKYTLELGLKWVTKTDDPDLRKAAYGLFGALSSVMKEEMAEFLPSIIELAVETLNSAEGIVVSVVWIFPDVSEQKMLYMMLFVASQNICFF